MEPPSEATPLIAPQEAEPRYIQPEVDRVLALSDIWQELRVPPPVRIGSHDVVDRAYDLIVLFHVHIALRARSRVVVRGEEDLTVEEVVEEDLEAVEKAMRLDEDFFRQLKYMKQLEAFLLTSFPWSEDSARTVRCECGWSFVTSVTYVPHLE